MSRATLAWDRLVAVVLGIVLVGGGVLAILWWGGWLLNLPQRIQLAWAPGLTHQPWWAWAAGIAGVLLVLLGLRWLLAHLPRGSVGSLTLPGSSDDGRLRVQASAVAHAFADAFAAYPAVGSARGSITVDRGQLVARIRATIDPDTDLAKVAAAADETSSQLAQVLGRDDVACRIQLRVARGSSDLARVR